MAYAVVQDVPASWERYASIAAAIDDERPAGLVLHVAGPTDEGFRTIEIWQTREAWQRWHERSGSTASDALPWSAATLRELSTKNAVCGPDTTSTSPRPEPTTQAGSE